MSFGTGENSLAGVFELFKKQERMSACPSGICCVIQEAQSDSYIKVKCSKLPYSNTVCENFLSGGVEIILTKK